MKRLQPLLLAAMMTCLTVPLVVLGETLSTDWKGLYILAFVPFTVLEGIWSKRIYRRERLSGAPLVWRLVAEGLVLLLILKLFSYFGRGFQPLLDDLASWIREPSTFITMDFVLLTPLMVSVWSASRKLQTDLNRLSDPLELGENRQSSRDSIRTFIFFGGFWLLLISGLLLGFAKDHFSLNRGNSLLIEVTVICYLGLSLLLLAYVQYLRRHMEWQLEGLPVPDVITRRWVWWGFMFVIGIFLIAALLPAAYRHGPEQLLLRAFDVLLYLGQLFIALLTLFFSPFFWVLGLLKGEETSAELPPVELPEVSPPSTHQIPLWWMNFRHVLQYIIIFALLIIIFITYSRNRAIRLPRLGNIPQYLKERLHNIWIWLKGLLSRARVSLYTFQLTRRHPPEAIEKQTTEKWSILRAFTARARVRRYYFSLLRRASEAGLQRAPQQTPQEYEEELTTKLPDEQMELATLTDAFIHARYDSKEVLEEEIPLVRKAWYAVRNKLRKSLLQTRD
jgi:hypothetical protein